MASPKRKVQGVESSAQLEREVEPVFDFSLPDIPSEKTESKPPTEKSEHQLPDFLGYLPPVGSKKKLKKTMVVEPELKDSTEKEYEETDGFLISEMTRQEAESLLLSNPNYKSGVYLIRHVAKYTDKSTVCALSVKLEANRVFHVRIARDGKKYSIGQHKFTSLTELINYFKAGANGLPCRLTHSCYAENYEMDGSSSIPIEIRAMDERSIELFNKSLEEGKYKSYAVRVMVVGHYGVGKTTLSKKLLGLNFDSSLYESTEGLEIYVGHCSVHKESRTWNKGREKEGEKAVGPSVNFTYRYNDEHFRFNHPSFTDIPSTFYSDQDTDLAQLLREHGVIDDMIEIAKAMDKNIDSSKTDQIMENEEKSEATFEEVEEPLHVVHSKEQQKIPESFNLLKEMLGKRENEPAKHFSIELWDFGGQGGFYCTHQSFLSYRSVYLLVFDISKSLDDYLNDEDLDPSERRKSTVREFLSFWINSIKTYAGGLVCGCPKIIVVGTHLDNVEKSKRFQRVDEYLATIREAYTEDIASGQLILDRKLMFGFHEEDDIEILQRTIVTVAEEQPFWGEELPKAWIPFQHRIAVLRKNDMKIISFEEIQDFNITLPVPLNQENIDLCLRFLHSVGSIIFYSQKGLSAYVVLEPKLLVTTLRSLITCESFCAKEKVRQGAFKILQQNGMISKERIEEIWKLPDFSTLISFKDHLLAIMEHVDLIARPKIYQNGTIVVTDSFFIPAMAKDPPSHKWLTSIMNSSRVLTCYVDFSKSFLSPAVYYRLISSCIYIWPVHQNKLYFGCCQLRLDPQHRMLIMKSGDRICLVFEHRRTADVINKNLMNGVLDVLVDILQDIVDLYPGRKDAPFFTINGNFNEEIKKPTQTEGCTSSCILGRNDILCSRPTDLELMRFAKTWLGAKDNLVLIAVELGVDMRELEQIEHDHRDNLVLKTFYVLERWSRKMGKECSFEDLIEASGCDIHTICRIMKEDDAIVHQTIPTERLEEKCTDEMIDKVSVMVGRDFIHFGLELGLHQEDIEEIRNSKDTRGLFDMNQRIMTVTRDHRPGGSLSVRSLSCALLRIGHVKAFEYFVDQFLTEHDDTEDEW